VAEEGWEGVSDAGEPGASGEDAEGDGWVGYLDFLWCENEPLLNDQTGQTKICVGHLSAINLPSYHYFIGVMPVMSDTLLLVERVRNTIQLGEGQFREFKSALHGLPGAKKPRSVGAICDDIAEALVAFANADGGELLVGVEDNGSITGLPHNQAEIEMMLGAVHTHVQANSHLPLNASVELKLDHHRILFFSVSKGSTEIFQLADGRCMRRVEKTSMPANANQLLFDKQEIRSREYDRAFVDGASVIDLDVDFITSIAESYLRGLSAERYLQQIGLAEYAPGGLRLRMAALLLFAKNVNLWHPRSQVRVLKVAGTELKSGSQYNVQSDEVVSGNIFHLLRRAWEVLRPFLANRTEFGVGGTFEQTYIYPELACREALTNAIAHRDYSSHNGVDVFVFDDRMEFRNPGALLSTLKISDLVSLGGAHESRNALIAKVLRENKFMRELGEGMKRMFELMTANELQEPRIESGGTAFHITLPHRSVFSSQQEEWLGLFIKYDLTPLQKKIVVLGINERQVSVADIYKAISTTDRNIFDPEVTGLRRARILEEIRTNIQASRYSRRHKIAKAEVPRFSVQVPNAQGKLTLNALEPLLITAEPKMVNAVTTTRRRDPLRSVYVSNLPSRLTSQELKALFAPVATPEEIFLPKMGEGPEIRGYAFVTFSTPEEAQAIIKKFNSSQFESRKIGVRKYNDREKPARPTYPRSRMANKT
jgi:ATP-dependent DNA helicase RecG